MKNKGTLALIVAAFLMSAFHQNAHAQLFRSTTKVGTTAAQFLKIGVGARALAMGSAHVGVARDISAIYWNVGAISRVEHASELTFTHANWLADIQYDFAAGMLQIGELGMFGLSVTSMSAPDDPVRTLEFPEGDGRTWNASSIAFGLSYARNLTDRFSIGFNAKYVRESIWSESATGIAVDFGTLYLSEIKGLSLGAAISNFGSKMQLSGRDLYFNNDPNGGIGSGPNNIPAEYRTEPFDLPLTFRIGVAYDWQAEEDFRVTTAVDATHPNDNTEYINSGIELAWREIVFVRAGYKSLLLRDSEQGLSLGVGLNYTIENTATLKLDYAYAAYGRLKSVQYITLGIGL